MNKQDGGEEDEFPFTSAQATKSNDDEDDNDLNESSLVLGETQADTSQDRPKSEDGEYILQEPLIDNRKAVDDDEEDESDDRRSRTPTPPPNRHTIKGSASTWRKWTSTERAIAWSSERTESEDLSVHLFNAHHLNLRASRLHQEQLSLPPAKRKPIWQPWKHWTSWPMRPDIVPRLHTVSFPHTENEPVFRSIKDSKTARSQLQGAMGACVLREATVRLTKELSTNDIASRLLAMQETLRQNADRADTSDTASIATSAAVNPEAKSRVTSQGSSPGGSQRSQPGGATDSKDNALPVPVISADDDEALRIVAPSISSVLSKLDTLLMSLHVVREAYFRKGDESDSSSSSGDNESDGKPPRAQSTKGESKSTGRRSSKTADTENLGARRSQSRTRGRSTSKRPRSLSVGTRSRSLANIRGKFGLRDWSDVLGMAAIVGWDKDTLERATLRCATLLKEKMDFEVIGAEKHALEEEEKVESGGEIEAGVHVDGFLRPIKKRKGWKDMNRTRRRKRVKDELSD